MAVSSLAVVARGRTANNRLGREQRSVVGRYTIRTPPSARREALGIY